MFLVVSIRLCPIWWAFPHRRHGRRHPCHPEAIMLAVKATRALAGVREAPPAATPTRAGDPSGGAFATRRLASGHGSVGRDDYQAHDFFLGSFRGHCEHDPPAPGVDVVGAGRDRGVDGAYPVFERAVKAGIAVDVDRGCAGGLGVRPADAGEDAGSLVRPEPTPRRVRRLADSG